jgi:hypothetical protein
VLLTPLLNSLTLTGTVCAVTSVMNVFRWSSSCQSAGEVTLKNKMSDTKRVGNQNTKWDRVWGVYSIGI